MTRHYTFLGITAACALLTLSAGSALQSPGEPRYRAPRLPDGTPDLSGVWSTGVTLDLEQPNLPFTPGGKAIFYKDHPAGDDPVGIRCMPSGLPRLSVTPFPIRFVQTAERVAILYEYGVYYRLIHMNTREHPKDLAPSWFGHSIGWYEGDSLVIDVVGLRDDTWFDSVGHMHSDQLHLVERWTRTGPDAMSYELTVDDPKIFTRPWKLTTKRTLRPEWELMEYICQENNKEAEKYWKKPQE